MNLERIEAENITGSDQLDALVYLAEYAKVHFCDAHFTGYICIAILACECMLVCSSTSDHTCKHNRGALSRIGTCRCRSKVLQGSTEQSQQRVYGCKVLQHSCLLGMQNCCVGFENTAKTTASQAQVSDVMQQKRLLQGPDS